MTCTRGHGRSKDIAVSIFMVTINATTIQP